MLNIGEDIRSPSDLKHRLSTFSKQLHRAKQRMVLTVNTRQELSGQETGACRRTSEDLEAFEKGDKTRLHGTSGAGA